MNAHELLIGLSRQTLGHKPHTKIDRRTLDDRPPNKTKTTRFGAVACTNKH